MGYHHYDMGSKHEKWHQGHFLALLVALSYSFTRIGWMFIIPLISLLLFGRISQYLFLGFVEKSALVCLRSKNCLWARRCTKAGTQRRWPPIKMCRSKWKSGLTILYHTRPNHTRLYRKIWKVVLTILVHHPLKLAAAFSQSIFPPSQEDKELLKLFQP